MTADATSSHHRAHPPAPRPGREAYLDRIAEAREAQPSTAPCCPAATSPMALPSAARRTRRRWRGDQVPNLGIVTSYNDMLSAHQPYRDAIPTLIKEAAREAGATAQVAGGVPAMCDGVTQGQPGMELSLFSRDVIAMATAIALSHNMFDAARLSRHLRQDRAGPADRRADLRPSAGGVRAGRADDHRACPTTRRPRSASSMPKARSAAPSCSRPRPSPITRPAPAPSTAPPTPTRC